MGWSSENSDTSDDDEVVEVDEADQPAPAKKAKTGDVNEEGLKQQALTALRKMKMGLLHQLEGINALESVCEDTPLHLLPGLLQSTQQKFGGGPFTPKSEPGTPVKPEVKTEGEGEGEPTPSTSTTSTGAKAESGASDEAQAVWVSASSYRCSACDLMFGSRNGCKSHIMSAHTGSFLLCPFCDWSTSNKDSLRRHLKKSHQ